MPRRPLHLTGAVSSWLSRRSHGPVCRRRAFEACVRRVSELPGKRSVLFLRRDCCSSVPCTCVTCAALVYPAVIYRSILRSLFHSFKKKNNNNFYFILFFFYKGM